MTNINCDYTYCINNTKGICIAQNIEVGILNFYDDCPSCLSSGGE